MKTPFEWALAITDRLQARGIYINPPTAWDVIIPVVEEMQKEWAGGKGVADCTPEDLGLSPGASLREHIGELRMRLVLARADGGYLQAALNREKDENLRLREALDRINKCEGGLREFHDHAIDVSWKALSSSEFPAGRVADAGTPPAADSADLLNAAGRENL